MLSPHPVTDGRGGAVWVKRVKAEEGGGTSDLAQPYFTAKESEVQRVPCPGLYT